MRLTGCWTWDKAQIRKLVNVIDPSTPSDSYNTAYIAKFKSVKLLQIYWLIHFKSTLATLMILLPKYEVIMDNGHNKVISLTSEKLVLYLKNEPSCPLKSWRNNLLLKISTSTNSRGYFMTSMSETCKRCLPDLPKEANESAAIDAYNINLMAMKHWDWYSNAAPTLPRDLESWPSLHDKLLAAALEAGVPGALAHILKGFIYGKANNSIYFHDAFKSGFGIEVEARILDVIGLCVCNVVVGYRARSHVECPSVESNFPPKLDNGVESDLFTLLCVVTNIGDYELVSKKILWEFVAKERGLDIAHMASLKLINVKCLIDLDQWLSRWGFKDIRFEIGELDVF
ncbi:synaptobrevin, WD40/YVTN repeat-like-containing domain protein [Tanacetum coccineum]